MPPRYELEYSKDYIGYLECMQLVRKLASKNDNGHYINKDMDVSPYDKLADICEEADNILIDWWGEDWHEHYLQKGQKND